MALNVFVLNKEELYQLTEREAVSFGPGSAAGAVYIVGHQDWEVFPGRDECTEDPWQCLLPRLSCTSATTKDMH